MAIKINWERLLHQHGVEFIERGSNVKRGNINIHCPFCGAADPSHHMGINLETSWWGCWRNQNHRGRSPLRLLVALLGISWRRAREIAGVDDDYVDPDGFTALAARLLGNAVQAPQQDVDQQVLHMPREFREITDSVATRRAFNYLVDGRGFEVDTVQNLISDYSLKFSIVGSFKDRVIMPFFYFGALVTWTGRAIGSSSLRYKDLDLDSCVVPAKEMLYNHDSTLQRGRYLVVVEGPMDALKLDFYGKSYGVRAVALATNSISDEQIWLIEDAASKFRKVFVMMDNASMLGVVDSMRMKEKMTQITNLSFVPVPEGYKDAGEMPKRAVIDFCRGVAA